MKRKSKPQQTETLFAIMFTPADFEVLIARPTCFHFTEAGSEIPVEIPDAIFHDSEVGDRLCFDAAAPGAGRVCYLVTRKDATGLYGIETENSIRELSPSDVF